MLFHAQHSIQIRLIFHDLSGDLIISGIAWKRSLETNEDRVGKRCGPVNRHFTMAPLSNSRHGDHGFRIQRGYLGSEERDEQTYERNGLRLKVH